MLFHKGKLLSLSLTLTLSVKRESEKKKREKVNQVKINSLLSVYGGRKYRENWVLCNSK